MRIGVDARELQGRPTGVGRYLRNLLRAWPEAADELILYFNGPPPDVSTAPTAAVQRGLGPSRRGVVWQERLLPPAAAADRLDVFFAPAYSCPLRVRSPRVVTVHDLSFFSLPEDFTVGDGLRRRLTVAASIAASRRVLVPSEFTRREIAGRFPQASAKVRVTAEAAAVDLPPAPPREEARRRLGVEGPLVLSVGAILNRRRAPTMLRAAALLTRRWPGLVFEVVGENRTRPELDLPGLAGRLGLGPNVRFSGFVPDEGLALRYAAADVFVYLSQYEGFGLPVLEAMARGIPVVTADRPCLNELYADAAALVDPDDERAVAEAVSGLLDRGRAAEASARGRALAARFSWNEAARLTRQALAEAAA